MPRQLKTTGDLRAALAEILDGVRDGSIDPQKANAAVKVAAQINQSFMAEVEVARLHLMNKLAHKPLGEMLIGSPASLPAPMLEGKAEPSSVPHKARLADESMRPRVKQTNTVAESVTSDVLGDPAPGRSALDQRKGRA